MKHFAAALIYALLIFVMGMTKLGDGDKLFLAVVAIWLLRRVTRPLF